MKKITYILVLIAFFSCISNSMAQKKEKTDINQKLVKKPKFEDPDNHKIVRLDPAIHKQIAPGFILFTGAITTISKNQSICNTSYKNAVSIEVKSVIGAGSGIVNMISLKQEIMMGFIESQINDTDELQNNFSKGQEFMFTIREGLCLGSSKTSYEMVRYTPIKN